MPCSPSVLINRTGTTASSTTRRKRRGCALNCSMRWPAPARCWWPRTCRSRRWAGCPATARHSAGCRRSGISDQVFWTSRHQWSRARAHSSPCRNPPIRWRSTMNTVTRTLAATALALSMQAGLSAQAAAPAHPSAPSAVTRTASTITTADGVQLYYKDWGPKNGPVVTFSHGWPLDSDSWESQMMFLADHGYRVVAHDRRGHGRSSQPWDGNDMDHYADDLATVINTLDLKDVTLVGFSTGGGEVARYIGRHGTGRVKKAVLISSVPPFMLKTADNPGGVPIEVFDGIRKAQLEN